MTGLVSTGEAFARADGLPVVAVGRYVAVPRPVKGISPLPRPADHAVLLFDDGTGVYLEPLDSPASTRPEDERARFDGRRVRVTGVAHQRMPSRGASLVDPCLSEVTEIREA